VSKFFSVGGSDVLGLRSLKYRDVNLVTIGYYAIVYCSVPPNMIETARVPRGTVTVPWMV
jgi:hypothetical protein